MILIDLFYDKIQFKIVDNNCTKFYSFELLVSLSKNEYK